MVVEPGIYEHFKGKRYLVLGVGLHTEDESQFVVYEPLYDCEHQFFVRPLKMFLGTVLKGSKRVPRFKKVEEPDV